MKKEWLEEFKVDTIKNMMVSIIFGIGASIIFFWFQFSSLFNDRTIISSESLNKAVNADMLLVTNMLYVVMVILVVVLFSFASYVCITILRFIIFYYKFRKGENK